MEPYILAEKIGPYLLSEMEISEPAVERRKSFVGLAHQEAQAIAEVRDILTKNAQSLADVFFSHLQQFAEARPLFDNAETLEEARNLKVEHLKAMAVGHYGLSYVNQRLRLGEIYTEAELDVGIFLGAFQAMLGSIGERIAEKFQGDAHAAHQHLSTLQKVAFFDIALIVDAMVFTRERTIREQQHSIRELSTPVLKLKDRLLLLPIIGQLDDKRARALTENLLRSIRQHRARVAVLDVTGVARLDSRIANHLVGTVEASRLMGAHVIITGLTPEVAQSLMPLGLDVSRLNTVGDLEEGLEEAERLLVRPR